MSASREKKARQERGADYLSPKQQKALEEQKANRRTTTIFAVCAAVFIVAVAAMALYQSGVIQRGAAAASVNGKTYTVADMAYYYYNQRASLANSGSVSSSTSLRDQSYTSSEEYETWYDYLADQSLRSLAATELAAQAAKDAGFTGGDEVEQNVSDTMASLASSASGSGYSVSGYIKAIFGGLMTRSAFERNLRTSALAEAYIASKSNVENYSEAELTAKYEADPGSCSYAEYELAVFFDDSVSTDEETEASEDAAPTGAEIAESALARVAAGEDFETVAADLNGSYSRTYAYSDTSSELTDWLFDSARKAGDTTVLDYNYYGYSYGAMAVIFHSAARPEFHSVSVRHILVDDEATANDLLAQFNAGDRTEESFAALATENSTDTGSSSDGGLYTGVRVGQMVAPFEDWCFDASRQSGDTGVVQTDYGYHVMYFVSASSRPYWQELAAASLANAFSENLTEGVPTALLSGMKYIDK